MASNLQLLGHGERHVLLGFHSAGTRLVFGDVYGGVEFWPYCCHGDGHFYSWVKL